MRFIENYKRKQQAQKAAEQMWNYIKRGVSLEVPFSKDPKDPATLAVMELQRKHPEVRLKVYQSRGVVVGMHSAGVPNARGPVSPEAWEGLKRGGYHGLDGQQLSNADVEANLDAHVAWMNAQGLDPNVGEKEAKEAEMEKHSIVLGASSALRESSAQRAQRIANEVYDREMSGASDSPAVAMQQAVTAVKEHEGTGNGDAEIQRAVDEFNKTKLLTPEAKSE